MLARTRQLVELQVHRPLPNPGNRALPPPIAHSTSVPLKETHRMNNLHRELAPISDGAWAQIEEEVSRTFKRYIAGRRAVDVKAPAGSTLAGVGTGHLHPIASPREGVLARQREAKPLVELR